ncbi:hypothetical protein NliqN6_5313 [Naganishia liquefaciens]|uniref:VanZ family protein n=1 Tax=Naganishia liquefaciens TaxID=104408 RepID=A0A8H3TXV3_9TREE|nr:hypothetical protein NliqN6_5313 [Naganishia liquefaciens]
MHPVLAHTTPLPAATPLRIRPAVLALLAAWSTLLAILGFAPFGSAIPIHDKLLHFIGIGVLTAITYFIIDVPDAARRIWYYRRAPMILTLVLAFLGAGILSEVLQGLLPWKTFQYGDILANILGASLAYALSHACLIRHRRNATLRALYLPVAQERPTTTRAGSMDSVGTWEMEEAAPQSQSGRAVGGGEIGD